MAYAAVVAVRALSWIMAQKMEVVRDAYITVERGFGGVASVAGGAKVKQRPASGFMEICEMWLYSIR